MGENTEVTVEVDGSLAQVAYNRMDFIISEISAVLKDADFGDTTDKIIRVVITIEK